MARTVNRPYRMGRWTLTVPLATMVLLALHSGISALLYSAYLIAGRHLLADPSLDGRMTAASLPQVASGSVPPMDTEYLVDLPLWLRWLCSAPTLIFVVVLAAATVLVTVAIRRLASGFTGPALIRPWKVLAMVLILGGMVQGLVDTAAVLALRDHYHSRVVLPSDAATAFFMMPWFTIVLGFLATAMAVALAARATGHGLATVAYPV